MSLENDVGQKGVLQYDDVAGTIVAAKDKVILGVGKQDGLIVITVPLIATSLATHVFIANDNYQLVSAQEVHSVVSTSGVCDVTVCTGTQAPSAGTTQLATTFDLSAGVAVNTVTNKALIASPTVIAAGNRVALNLSGTLTGLVSCVTLTLKRV